MRLSAVRSKDKLYNSPHLRARAAFSGPGLTATQNPRKSTMVSQLVARSRTAGTTNEVPLAALLKIVDVDRFVELSALENYAGQLSYNALYRAHAVAFALREVEMLHAAMTPMSFHLMINDIAEALSDSYATA